MSTRSTTHFAYRDIVSAIVYRHSDGYPEGAGADILRFFDEVKAQATDTRFGDPDYLAAKYVVFLADIFARKYVRQPDGSYDWEPAAKLDFISVGVLLEDPGDIEFRYVVECDNFINGRPTVRVERPDGTILGEIENVLAQLAPSLS